MSEENFLDREAAVKVLQSEAGVSYLARLGWYLSTAGRSFYDAPAADQEPNMEALQQVNEMVGVIFSSIRSMLASDERLSEGDAFFREVFSQANEPHSARVLEWAATKALEPFQNSY